MNSARDERWEVNLLLNIADNFLNPKDYIYLQSGLFEVLCTFEKEHRKGDMQ